MPIILKGIYRSEVKYMNIDTSNNILASFQTYSFKESINVESAKLGKLLESAPAPAQSSPVVQNGHVNILA